LIFDKKYLYREYKKKYKNMDDQEKINELNEKISKKEKLIEEIKTKLDELFSNKYFFLDIILANSNPDITLVENKSL